MNDELRRKVVARKISYFIAILALFTLSMFWRGVFRLPIGNADKALRDEAGKEAADLSTADRIARLPIRFQAEDLEMRDLDLGDPEIAGAAAQVSLLGARGPLVTYLWLQTIRAQTRGEYHDMERSAKLLSKLQPHFIEPWIFQAWNIAYNVSVETDKLGDQYYYIAKGISFLSEGDRVNTRVYRSGKNVFNVGSPDIRYQLGFFYQNKFTVSDKVRTLRSLAQLSFIPPIDRDPTKYTKDGKADGPVVPERFLKFCEEHPQLVRRLKTELNLKSPEQVMAFLATNRDVPSRFDLVNSEALPDEKAFPVLPRPGANADRELEDFIVGLRKKEADRTRAGQDTLDIVQVARAWYEHAQAVVPPPVEGEPAAVPQRGEYDPFRYRIPSKPAMVVFRMAPARAQTYVAEQLQKDGWFDSESTWEPDAASDRTAKWFGGLMKTPQSAGPDSGKIILKTGPGANAREEWEKTYSLWVRFGKANGLNEEHRLTQENLANETVKKGLGMLGAPLSRYYSDDDLAKLGLEQKHLRARQAVMYYDQNRRVTQYQFFLDQSQIEKDPELSRTRQMFWTARELHDQNRIEEEVRMRLKAAAQWRLLLGSQKYRAFYFGERSDSLHEATLEQETALAKLLIKDPIVTERLKSFNGLLGVFAPNLVHAPNPNLARFIAEDEAQLRIAQAVVLADPSDPLNRKARELVERVKKDSPGVTVEATIRGYLLDEYDWMKKYTDSKKSITWVKPDIRLSYMIKEGLVAIPEDPNAPEKPKPGEPIKPLKIKPTPGQ